MSKKVLVLIAFLLLLASLLYSYRIELGGWLAGETFFAGKPTSYWSREIKEYKRKGEKHSLYVQEKLSSRVRPRPTPPKSIWDWPSDILRSSREDDEEPEMPRVLYRDKNAVPVLNELVSDADEGVAAEA